MYHLNHFLFQSPYSKTANNSTLTLYRQQAQSVIQKREAKDQELNDRREELHDLETKHKKIQAEIDLERSTMTVSNISPEQKHRIKMDLKNLNDIYKARRDERNLRLEKLETLTGQEKDLTAEKDRLIISATSLENKFGVPGFITKMAEQLAKEQDIEFSADRDPLKAMKKELDDAMANSLEPTEMATIIEKTSRLLQDRQKQLKPLQKQIKELRKVSAELAIERGERKVQYDQLKEQLENTSAALESNVQGQRRSVAQEAERYYKLDSDLVTAQVISKRLGKLFKIEKMIRNTKKIF